MARIRTPDELERHIQSLRTEALARRRRGEAEHLPSLMQIRERVYQDLAQNGVAIYASPDHPLAPIQLQAVLQELRADGWQGVYQPLLALHDAYRLHVLIVCTLPLSNAWPPMDPANNLRYFARHIAS